MINVSLKRDNNWGKVTFKNYIDVNFSNKTLIFNEITTLTG